MPSTSVSGLCVVKCAVQTALLVIALETASEDNNTQLSISNIGPSANL